MSNAGRTVTGVVISTPTVHHVTSMGNAAKQFVVQGQPGYDAVVLVTAGNSSLGYTIGNPEYRDLIHTFTLDGRGKVVKAERYHGI